MTNQYLSNMDPGTCAFCGKPTDRFAANPGMWPLRFTHPDGTGYARDHHVKCVQERLFRSPDEPTADGLLRDDELTPCDCTPDTSTGDQTK